jgi:DNA-binding GntR family transcriptional regulator
MRRSTKQCIYKALKQEILEGTVRPGDRIDDHATAARFACSRAPVREALLALEQDGLVRVAPRHGYFASEISVSAALDAYQLRLILEPIATALAAAHITDEELIKLQALAVVEDDSSDAGLSGTVAANRAFHVGVARASGNARLARLMGELLDELNRLAYVELRAGRSVASWGAEHGEILAALAAHDPGRAAGVVRATFLRDEGLLPGRARAELVQVLEEAHRGETACTV